MPECRSQKPKLIIEPGPNTNGYTVTFRHDKCNNIVITHIIPQTDSASGTVRVTGDAAFEVIDSGLSQSFQSCLNEVLAAVLAVTCYM